MQTTKQANKDGVVSMLGTIGIYKGKDKRTGSPLYANIPFVTYGAATEYIKPDTKMILVGRLNSYVKQDESQYGKLIVQIKVLLAYQIEQASQDVSVTDSDLPF